MKYNIALPPLFAALVLLSSVFIHSISAVAQTREPEVLELPQPRTPFSEGKNNSLGFEVVVNNFGFGVGGHYSRILGPFTELTFHAGVTGIRDVSEQTFTDPFFGQQIIPNKYNRAIGFPALIGIKQRFFARKIADNFRFFASAAGGPVMAFVYPYFKDTDNNGFRNVITVNGNILRQEPINDFFTGWKEGTTEWGAAGSFKVGVDIGENFSKLTTVEFGYLFYYFDQGIQIMAPNRPVFNDQGEVMFDSENRYVTEPFFSEKKYFGTPQITLTFGGMW